MALNKYIIERDIPEVGTLERQQLAEAAIGKMIDPTTEKTG